MKDEFTGHKSQIPTQKSVLFCGDAENCYHVSRESLSIDIYASTSSPVGIQGQVQPDESHLTATVSPCDQALVVEQILQEDQTAAGCENSIPSEPLHSKTKKEEKSEYGQTDKSVVEDVLQEVMTTTQEVNTVSATAL